MPDQPRTTTLNCIHSFADASFALWCDLAGLPLAWKRALLGHAALDVTQKYGRQESERASWMRRRLCGHCSLWDNQWDTRSG